MLCSSVQQQVLHAMGELDIGKRRKTMEGRIMEQKGMLCRAWGERHLIYKAMSGNFREIQDYGIQ